MVNKKPYVKPFSDILKINYDFSLDSNIQNINYQLIETEFKVNNIVTSFEYLNENKTNNTASYITNKTSYYIDKICFKLPVVVKVSVTAGGKSGIGTLSVVREETTTAVVKIN